MAERKAALVIRHHEKLKGQELGRRRKVGRSETGTIYERTMVISTDRRGGTMTLRRIEVDLDQPTRDGDHTISLLTNLPCEAADAIKVAASIGHGGKLKPPFKS